MLMEIIAWIVIGAIAGWLASIVMGTNAQQSLMTDIILGIVGAFVGGFLLGLLGIGGGADAPDFNIASLLTAFIGAMIVIFIARQLQRRT